MIPAVRRGRRAPSRSPCSHLAEAAKSSAAARERRRVKDALGEAVALKLEQSRKNAKPNANVVKPRRGYNAVTSRRRRDEGEEAKLRRGSSRGQGRAEGGRSRIPRQRRCLLPVGAISADISCRPEGRRHRHHDRQGLRRRHEALELRRSARHRTACRSRHRSHGSTGNRQDPGKIFKNKKMAGHLGDERVTTQNLEIAARRCRARPAAVKGAVPGAEGRLVLVRDAVKRARHADAPFPAALESAQAAGRSLRATMQARRHHPRQRHGRRDRAARRRCSAPQPRADIMARVVHWQLAKRRAGTHKAQGHGRGLGHAPRSSIAEGHRQCPPGLAARAAVPQGGVVHGPVVRDHGYSLNKKVRALGLITRSQPEGGRGQARRARRRDAAADAKTGALAKQLKALGWTSALVVDGRGRTRTSPAPPATCRRSHVLPTIGANVYDILHARRARGDARRRRSAEGAPGMSGSAREPAASDPVIEPRARCTRPSSRRW